MYPVNKVLQAGGRLIRSEQERGILMLVDDRYLQAQYRSLLPKSGESMRYWRRVDCLLSNKEGVHDSI
ncbi:helicase C-terminal domain-containing protein [Paenibacillus lautus]|uniref:helicase C-terminal domain-containing protein n=1 Tax=Paenibacillus lautus TaxID=1401 RepID=UPI003D27D064